MTHILKYIKKYLRNEAMYFQEYDSVVDHVWFINRSFHLFSHDTIFVSLVHICQASVHPV